jgi:hypothetical protein
MEPLQDKLLILFTKLYFEISSEKYYSPILLLLYLFAF